MLIFLHGFPQGAFVWDELLEHFSKPENGAYRCVASNLRGFEKSSAPSEASAYRPKFLVQDIAALVAIETGGKQPLACLVAYDWGGAVALNLANQHPELPTNWPSSTRHTLALFSANSKTIRHSKLPAPT